MKKYSNYEVSIPYEDMISLRKSGKLNLGMDDELAIKLTNDARFAPKSIKSTMAMHFWSWIAVGQFIYSIYESFTGLWWVFIPSFFLMFAIHKANKKGTSQNLLDEAQTDKDFYERVRKEKLWQYEISEEDVKKYKIKK
jgi:hypothetical protein